MMLARIGEEVVAWLKTFASAAVYATLIVTFGFQVARVEGKSMEPTLEDQDRLIVNKALYRFFGLPEPGDIVITTPITFLATVNSIIYAGGTPEFVDIDPITYNIDPHLVEEKVRRPRGVPRRAFHKLNTGF